MGYLLLYREQALVVVGVHLEAGVICGDGEDEGVPEKCGSVGRVITREMMRILQLVEKQDIAYKLSWCDNAWHVERAWSNMNKSQLMGVVT